MGFANLSISVHIVQPEKCREALTEHSKEVFFVTLCGIAVLGTNKKLPFLVLLT